MVRARLTRFNLNRKGIAAMAMGPEVLGVCRQVAHKGKTFAEGISPRYSGEYARSFTVDDTIVAGIGKPPMTRVGARLVNTSDHAIIVEVGADNTPAYRVFAITLAHLAAEAKL